MYEYLAGADLVVNPSRSEGLPNVVLEALSVHTPVVATEVGGVSEVIEAGRSGWLVPPGDPGALAAAIGDALDDPARARAFADAGFDRVDREFSFGSQLETFVGVSKHIFQRAERP